MPLPRVLDDRLGLPSPPRLMELVKLGPFQLDSGGASGRLITDPGWLGSESAVG
jgi:hypothetical protein